MVSISEVSVKSDLAVYVRGYPFPPTCPVQHIEEALDYKPKDEDVFIVTYPKCGTTWLQQICYLIFSGGVPPPSTQELEKQAVYFEHDGLEAVKAIVKPGTIKYHLPHRLTPHNTNAKYIVVVRNPKDACVSFYYHYHNYHSDVFDGDFHDFFRKWVGGALYCGDYFEFILGWWRRRHDDNVLLLVFEDIKRDVRKAVLQVAAFLGATYRQSLLNNCHVLDDIVRFSNFDFMKKQSAGGLTTTGHLRKGKVGDWRSHFASEESHLVDDRIREVWGGSGLEKLWNNVIN